MSVILTSDASHARDDYRCHSHTRVSGQTSVLKVPLVMPNSAYSMTLLQQQFCGVNSAV